MFRTVRTQLAIGSLGFLLLVGGSVTATFLTVRAQADDATVINLAGRQRMLTQRMTWLAFAQPDSPDLAADIQLFDQTMRALRDGGATLDARGQTVLLPPAPDVALRAQLDAVSQTWVAFRAHLQPIDSTALQNESPVILAQLDSVVSGFGTRAQAKVVRLQFIQVIFLVAAFLLLGWGYGFTRRRIARPLAALSAAAQRITAGQLSASALSAADDELGDLARAFEAMRAEIATAREQLESRVTQRTYELTSAFEFSQEIVSQLELNHLLRSVTDRARALMRAEAVSLCLLAESGENLELAASSGEASGQAGLRQPIRRGLTARVVGAGETVMVEAACSACGFLSAHAPGQCAAAPLRVGQRTLGALCAIRSPSRAPFDADETRAFTLLANSAAIAIANAQLAEAGRRQAEQAAASAERDHLAAELHDHLAQTLGFLNLKADQAKEALATADIVRVGDELEHMQSAMRLAYEQVRAALVGLREPLPTAKASTANAERLAEKLAAWVADFHAASGLRADLVIADPTALSLSPVAQAQAQHIVREALTNARRHAKAQQVQVHVERVEGQACFVIEDDGIGFDPGALQGAHHLGLKIMRMRAERIGGAVSIEATPGGGAKIVARFPLTMEQAVAEVTAETPVGSTP